MTWSVNALAARAVALHARDATDARLLLDVLGLLDGDRIAPDDTRVYHLARMEAKQETHEPSLTKREKGCNTPPGLANLTPVAEQPKPKPRPKPKPVVKAPKPKAEKKPVNVKRGPKPKPIDHGSYPGYRAHYRRGELPVCGPCNDAYRVYKQDQRLLSRARLAAEKGAAQIAGELDVWLAEAQRSPDLSVRRSCAVAVSSLMALRIALDDLSRAERAAGKEAS